MILKLAQKFADSIGKKTLCVECLIGGIICSDSLTIKNLLGSVSLKQKELEMIMRIHMLQFEEKESDIIIVNKIIKKAESLRKFFKEDKLSIEVVLLAILNLSKKERPYIIQFLEEESQFKFISFLKDRIASFVRCEKIAKINFFPPLAEDLLAGEIKKKNVEVQEMLEPNSILDKFGVNLNIEAANGKFDGLIDYDNSLDKLYTVLCRKQKRNAILVGAAGVGKTSVVEMLAKNIVNGTAPDLLNNKVIYQINLSDMVGGTKYRGVFEKRLTKLIEEASLKKNVILFIDEIHTLVGAGGAGRRDDLEASNILKPALARGDISCIGATTPSEYDSKIKKDSALTRRFYKINMYPPTSKDMRKILPQIVAHQEVCHPVIYSQEFLNEVLNFCDRELPHKVFPDKLVDVLDHCAALSKIKFFQPPSELKEEELRLISNLDNLNEETFEVKSEEFQEKYEAWSKLIVSERASVTLEHLKAYLNNNSDDLFSEEKFLDFEEELKTLIINQENVENFLNSLRVVNKSKEKKAKIICVYSKSGAGKSFFLKELSKGFKYCGTEVINLSKNFLGLPSKLIGEEDSLVKKLVFHDKPVVIIDDFDEVATEGSNILLDAFKSGLLEGIDGEIADLSRALFIVSVKADSKQVGFGTEEIPFACLPKELEEFTEKIYLKLPSLEDKRKFLEEKAKKSGSEGMDFNFDEKIEGYGYLNRVWQLSVSQINKKKQEKQNN